MNIGSDKVDMNEAAPAPIASTGNSINDNPNNMMDRVLHGGSTSNSSPTAIVGGDDLQNKMNHSRDGDISAKLSPSNMAMNTNILQAAEGKVAGGSVDADQHLKKPPQSPSGEGKEDIKKKSQARKKWKKPKDKPNRPLSAYNLFFQSQRVELLGGDPEVAYIDKTKKRVHRKTHGKIGFVEMARLIGNKWKELPEEQKRPFIEDAAKLKKQYTLELDAWKVEEKRKKALAKKMKKNKDAAARAAAAKKRSSDELDGSSSSSVESSKRLRQMKGSGSVGSTDHLKTLSSAASGQQPMQMMAAAAASGLGGSSRGRSGMEAAEASSNALLQQFQGIMEPPQSPTRFTPEQVQIQILELQKQQIELQQKQARLVEMQQKLNRNQQQQQLHAAGIGGGGGGAGTPSDTSNATATNFQQQFMMQGSAMQYPSAMMGMGSGGAGGGLPGDDSMPSFHHSQMGYGIHQPNPFGGIGGTAADMMMEQRIQQQHHQQQHHQQNQLLQSPRPSSSSQFQSNPSTFPPDMATMMRLRRQFGL